MDQIDGRILAVLRENGRATASEIGRLVNLSVPAVAERMRKLEQNGTIERYTVRINRERQGYTLLAFVLVSIERTCQIAPFRRRIVQEPQVLECHHIAGQSDYLLKVLAKNTADLEHFLTDSLKMIDGVVSSNTIICLSTLKEEYNI